MRILKTILLIISVASLVVSCKDDHNTSPETAAINALNGSWITTGGYVKVDDTDISGSYANFKITFSTTNDGVYIYTVVNGSHAFSNIITDLWTFSGNEFSVIKRSDNVLMSYEVKDGFLTLKFTVLDPVEANGRVSGLFGNFEMKLKKK